MLHNTCCVQPDVNLDKLTTASLCYDPYFSIDATHTEYCGRFANDEQHKTATAFVKQETVRDIPHLVLYAKKDIAPGMEITYDYGDVKAP